MKKLMFFLAIVLFSCGSPRNGYVGSRGVSDTVNIGSGSNTGTGDPLRSAFIKINKVIRKVDVIETDLNDTTSFLLEDIRDVVIISVGDTSVTAIVGRIVFKTSDKRFYGCKQISTSYKKWFPLDN